MIYLFLILFIPIAYYAKSIIKMIQPFIRIVRMKSRPYAISIENNGQSAQVATLFSKEQRMKSNFGNDKSICVNYMLNGYVFAQLLADLEVRQVLIDKLRIFTKSYPTVITSKVVTKFFDNSDVMCAGFESPIQNKLSETILYPNREHIIPFKNGIALDGSGKNQLIIRVEAGDKIVIELFPKVDKKELFMRELKRLKRNLLLKHNGGTTAVQTIVLVQ